MLLSLQDDDEGDDYDDDVYEDEDNEVGVGLVSGVNRFDPVEDCRAGYNVDEIGGQEGKSNVNNTVASKQTATHLDAAIQQTVMAFDEHDFFNTTRDVTLNGHANLTTTTATTTPTTAYTKQQPQHLTPLAPALAANSQPLLNTLDSSIITISSTMSPSLSNGTEEHNESNNKTAIQQFTNSPKRSGAIHSVTHSPTSRPLYASTSSAVTQQRLFSSNVLPSHLRQDSINSHDDTDEICLVPDVDFESGISIMDYSGGDNRESQPLLGGGSGSGNHYEVACNTFMGK